MALVRASSSSKKINTKNVRPEIGFSVSGYYRFSWLRDYKFEIRHAGGQEIRTNGLFGHRECASSILTLPGQSLGSALS